MYEISQIWNICISILFWVKSHVFKCLNMVSKPKNVAYIDETNKIYVVNGSTYVSFNIIHNRINSTKISTWGYAA